MAPAIVDKYRVPKPYDRRRKLKDEDYEEIRNLRLSGESLRSLANKFNVSKRLIQFIVSPDKKEENLKRRKERGGWKQYYEKEKNTNYARKHRGYKKELLEKNKLEKAIYRRQLTYQLYHIFGVNQHS